MIPTPHIDADKKGLIAKTVIMPGDPLRAKWIAERSLQKVTQVNQTRNMLAFTGKFKGEDVTIMGSGMGMASMGIYAHELYVGYGVENIIRIGSCGSYVKEINLYDVILAKASFLESNFLEIATGNKEKTIKADYELSRQAEMASKEINVKLHKKIVHCSDVFYRENSEHYKKIVREQNCSVVDMESAALLGIAKHLKRKAICLLTVSDHLVEKSQKTTSSEREKSFTEMVDVALRTAFNVKKNEL